MIPETTNWNRMNSFETVILYPIPGLNIYPFFGLFLFTDQKYAPMRHKRIMITTQHEAGVVDFKSDECDEPSLRLPGTFFKLYSQPRKILGA